MPERYGITIQNLGSHLQWLISQDKILAKAKGEHAIIECLKTIKDDLDEIQFEEDWVLKEIDGWIRRFYRYKFDQEITSKTAETLSYDANNWYREVMDYLSRCYYWEIRPDGISDLDKLFCDETFRFFDKKKYWTALSKVARHDLDEACLCLAFERPTAAAFLVMRATDDVLRKLYRLKKETEKKGFIDWAEIIKEIKGKIDDRLTENLEYLRKNFRNPVAHPEKIYDQKESERLLHTAISIIQQIIDELK